MFMFVYMWKFTIINYSIIIHHFYTSADDNFLGFFFFSHFIFNWNILIMDSWGTLTGFWLFCVHISMDILYAKCHLWAFYNCDNKYWFSYKKYETKKISVWRSLLYLRQLVSWNTHRIFDFLFSFMGVWIGFCVYGARGTLLRCYLISWFIKFDAFTLKKFAFYVLLDWF